MRPGSDHLVPLGVGGPPPEDSSTQPDVSVLRRDYLVREILEGARKERGLKRYEVAERVPAAETGGASGISRRTLQNWMKNPSRLSTQQIERLVIALGLDEETRANLYTLTKKLAPAPTASRLRRSPEVAVLQLHIDSQSLPACYFDYCCDVVITNRPYRDLFGRAPFHLGAMPLDNGMRYIFLHPSAPRQLGGGDPHLFREGWLMPALAYYLGLLQRRPNDRKLLALEEEIKALPRIRLAYEETPEWIVQKGDMHVDSSPRSLVDPRTGKLTRMHLITESHPGHPDLTHVTYVPSPLAP